jgi:hypothetical protein
MKLGATCACFFCEIGLLIEGVPSEVKSSVTEITGKLSLSSNILHVSKLEGSYEEDDLDKSSLGDSSLLQQPNRTVGDGVESGSGGINVSRKVDSSTGDDIFARKAS